MARRVHFLERLFSSLAVLIEAVLEVVPVVPVMVEFREFMLELLNVRVERSFGVAEERWY